MSLRIKISLIMAALVVLVLVLFDGVIYFSQSRIIYKQERLRHATIAESLAQVAEESLLSGDDFSLISYTFKLKKNSALAAAYVFDGEKYLSHTDRELARIRVAAPQAFDAPDDETISKEITVGGRKYLVRTVFSKKAAMVEIQNARDRIFAEILKASLLVFLAGLAAAYFVALSVASPVLKLSRAAREVGKGNFSVEIKTSSSAGAGDEMEMLKREFNSMVARLRELDEMKSDFVASITHELKSPLSAVDSYADLLCGEFIRAHGKADAAMKPALDEWMMDIAYIRKNTKRLFDFINDLLDTAKMEHGAFEVKKTRVEMPELIAQVVQLFAVNAKKASVELKVEQSPVPPAALMADGERIKQVLSNLIANALKYTRSGGKITVSAKAMGGLRPEVLYEPAGTAGADSNYVLVCVEDTGAGIPAPDLGRIFGKFEQLKTAGRLVRGAKGVGLGLYIAESIIKAHGGNIWVESTEGEGSRFYFSLSAIIENKA
ncbi:MAG: HAMP domain-containing sensor histidine kinase [Elusimicrobia bacterium]|nr:HAMP domain-containing sensor histidine kinase [Elusimicrobiota bacterium]